MKRSINEEHDEGPTVSADKRKKRKCEENDEQGSKFLHLDEDLLFEILKHVDARSLATAACVSKQLYKTALDERLWEMICTRDWEKIGYESRQLRSVVLALGGFRRLHSQFIWPLSKSPSPRNVSPSSSSSLSSFPSSGLRPKTPKRWGKDEVQLSLGLLSTLYYWKMK